MSAKHIERPALSAGDIVMAKAGRGKGRVFLVIAAAENGYVYISDGKTRKVSNAKLKKNLHLLRLGRVENTEFLTAPGAAADAEIRKILKEV